jgi:hypothetical protein
MNTRSRTRDVAPLVAGPVLGWRAWQFSGRGSSLRLRPVGPHGRAWPARRPARASCWKLRFHRAPDLSCTCGLHATRDPELLRSAPARTVVGTAALWGTVVEHALGYRARFGYPETLRLVCPICFAHSDIVRGREPVVVATFRGGRPMPLCDAHLEIALAVERSTPDVAPVSDVLGALLDLYGVEELALDRLAAGEPLRAGGVGTGRSAR